MGLSDYTLPSETIVFDEADPNGSFVVHGISFAHISKLAAMHTPTLVMLYGEFVKEKGDLRPETLGKFIHEAATRFPEMVADIIALAAGDVLLAPKAMALPFGLQLEAIDKIVGLTFVGESDLKKLVETVTRMSEGVSRAVEKTNRALPTRSVNGHGASASR